MIYAAIFIYTAAMTLANLSIAQWGPWVSLINSFLFMGLDLALRDWLHIHIKPWKMGVLIAFTGFLTYALNPAAGAIAIASAVAFTAAAVVDWSVFTRVKGSLLRRSNASNIAGAAVDSVVFPTLAFGVLMPHIVALQFAAKVAGGFVWWLLIDRVGRMVRGAWL